jgi:class 3 adenylate cyclase/tetratricopeptide (TPR) repeat protein
MLEPQANLLHLLGPYLPTDRFRSLLGGQTLPQHSHGTAMIVDISGFTPLTVSLVQQFGPQRASEELKRKLNPMFEAIGGLVFTHGGSVIRFVGDGFTAWFPDELPHRARLTPYLPGVVRAGVAALEMLDMMVFFKQLDLKIGLNPGVARRWVVGDERYGLLDVLAGPAIETAAEVIGRCEPHQARLGRGGLALLEKYPHIHFNYLDNGDLLLTRASSLLIEQSRAHRWEAWQAEGDIDEVLRQVKQFIDPVIQHQEMAGLGALAGELRYGTPMFLRFAGLDYEHDPQAEEKLGSYVRDVQSILADTRGRLVSLEVADKGSVLFAVFGAPIAYGDDSKRAIHAAMILRDLPAIHPSITQQNLGISRGLLYSGTVGGEVRHEYTSLGDETNVASRLMSADATGRILISKAVYDECAEWFDFAEGDTITPKGRIGTIRTFSPLRVNQRGRRNLRKTALVGRDKELAVLHHAFRQQATGRPGIVDIIGLAGIGKSRLAAEILHLSQEQGGMVSVGYCLSTGKSTPFLPWRDILRTVLEINPDWAITQAVAHLEGWVATRNPAWAARLPLLNDLLNLPIEETNTTRNLVGAARQQALFSLVLDMLYYQAQQSPLTLIVEDYHWLDEVSEGLAVELVNRLTAENVPLLLVLVRRTQAEVPPPQALLAALHASYLYKEMPLSELSRIATGELIQNYMGGLVPEELTSFVYAKTQGNAFFSLEIVGTLANQDFIKRIGPRVYIENDLAKLNLPQTVQGLILARLDNLEENQKLAIKLASVIGKQFEIRVLYQSLPLKRTPEQVMGYIRSLEQQQFISLDSLYPEPLYSFRHAITQEVTYQTLLYDQRKQWHWNVAASLETLQPNNWERLAYHFSQTDDVDRAYTYLVKAGDRSAREFANQAALDYWTQAIQLARSRKETFDLLCKCLEVQLRTGNLPGVEMDLAQLNQLTASAPENINWALRRARYAAEYAVNLHDWEAAKREAELGLAHSVGYRDPQMIWELYSLLVRIYAHLGHESHQQQATVKLRELSLELNDPLKRLRLAFNDMVELAATDPQSALEILESLQPDVDQAADPMLEANYWNSIGQILLQNGLYAQAESALRTQLLLWRQIGNRRMEGNTLYQLGWTLVNLGQYSLGGSHLRDSFALAGQVGDRWGESQALISLGVLAFRRAAYGEAIAYITRGYAFFEEFKLKAQMGRALWWSGQVYLAQQQWDFAIDQLRRALDAFTSSNHYHSIPQVEIALAYISLQRGEPVIPEELSATVSALEEGHWGFFQCVDVTLWQAAQLHQALGLEMSLLHQALGRYLQQHLPHLEGEEAQQAFWGMGQVTPLHDLFT